MQSTEHILSGHHRVSGTEKQVWTIPIVDIACTVVQPLRHALVLAAVVVVVAVVKYLHSIVEKVYTCTSRQSAVRPFRGCCCCRDGGRCGRLLHAYLLVYHVAV
jgi:hypothetical protein